MRPAVNVATTRVQRVLEVSIRDTIRSGEAIAWMAGSFGAALLMAIAILTCLGANEHGTDDALQATARFSFLLFWAAYSGSALAALFGPRWRFFKTSGRSFGLAFASAHLVHFGLVLWLCQIGAAPPLGSFVFFGIALLWTYILAILSVDWLHQAIGHKSWWWLSTIGLNYILFAFATDFTRFPFRTDPKHILAYLPFIILTIAAPVLRLTAWAQRMIGLLRQRPSPAR